MSRPLLAASLAALAAGCAPRDDGCDRHLPAHTRESELQTALIDAHPGATLCLAEGSYALRGELSIAQAGVTLRGAGRDATVLDFSRQDLGGNGMQIFSDGVTIEGLTVRDTPGDGIRATGVSRVTFRDTAVRWTAQASLENGAYGFYPVSSHHVRIERCLVQGARDAGIYVGQSDHVLVDGSEAFGNVAGIELENTTDAEIKNCHSHDNVGGILVFNLPNLVVQGGKHSNVHDNLVENNNQPTFAEKGTTVSNVPSGTGMILLAADENEIHDNDIHGNDTTGIVVVSYLEFIFGKTSDAKFDHFPQKNWIHDNRFAANGAHPQPPIDSVVMPPAPDLLWDGCLDDKLDPMVQRNCLSSNGAARCLDADFCGMKDMTKSDICAQECSYPPLGGQDP